MAVRSTSLAAWFVSQVFITQVPLDYSQLDGRQAIIAMLKVPAKVSQDSAAYRGPILFNPGQCLLLHYFMYLIMTSVVIEVGLEARVLSLSLLSVTNSSKSLVKSTTLSASTHGSLHTVFACERDL